MLYTIFRLALILIFKIFFRFQVFGKKHIPKQGGFILASNHASYLDPLALGVACSRKLSYMARHDLFLNPVFSWMLPKIGAFPVKRYSSDPAALKEAMRRLKGGQILVLFPEGSRRANGLSQEVEAGVGFLSAKLDVPVIPAFIKGTQVALPKGARFIRPTKVSVHFGRQVSIERRRVPYQDIARNVMEDIRHLACSELD